MTQPSFKIHCSFRHVSKFFSSSTRETWPNTKLAELLGVRSSNHPYRYKIPGKPKNLPKIEFPVDKPTFPHLQPAAQEEISCEYNSMKPNVERTDHPYPPTLRYTCKEHGALSDQQKADHKILSTKSVNFLIRSSSREFSKNSSRILYRSPAENSGGSKCQNAQNHCVKFKNKKKCRLSSACSKMQLQNCPPARKDICRNYYMAPPCSKKYAPYPSYSEACAEQLPDDPSECHQCPWRTCVTADDIHPGRPVRARRFSSSLSSKHIPTTENVAPESIFQTINVEVQSQRSGSCGNVKAPCKKPRGPCETRKEKQEKERKKRDHCENKNASGNIDKMISSDCIGDEYVTFNNISFSKKKRSDEGHPPPCIDSHEDSKKCPPADALKKPKYKKRPISTAVYKRPEDPYNKSE